MWMLETLTDERVILAFLQHDRIYAAYAVGDLEPALFADTTWYGAIETGPIEALALVYHGLTPPILFLMGVPEGVACLLAQANLPTQVFVTCRSRHLPVVQAQYAWTDVRPMLRMRVRPADFHPSEFEGSVVRLTAADIRELQALYGQGGDFAPDAFDPRRLEDGIFYGLFETEPHASRRLVAAAGTHLLARAYGIGAVGNVYTHPAARGLGYASAVTSAVTADLLAADLDVVLNVQENNDHALRIYQRLGYQIHCRFFEGPAQRLSV